jgi:hypothetical protein
VQTYHKYKDRGVVFIGLVVEGEDSKPYTQAFIDRFQIPWPNGYGAQATIGALGVAGFPTTLVIGADGRVAWNHELSGDLERAIDAALAKAQKS